MINTLKIPSLPKFRLSRVLGVSAALLLTSATASFAAAIPKLNAADTLIDVQLQAKHPGVTLKVTKTTPVNSRFIADAAVDAINALTSASKTLPSAIVTAALARVPQFAADVSKAALAKVYVGTGTPSSLSTTAKKNSEATKIVTAAFSKGLATYKVGKLANGNAFVGFGNKSDIATQITFQNLSGLGAAGDVIGTDPKVPSPLQVVVIAAVKAAIKVKGTDLEHNGISGAVAGAIYEGAGSSNASIKDNTTANDAIVKAILKTAAKTAQTHALEIAQAAGYAFATTYRQTNGNHATEVGLAQFVADNVTDIVAAIQSGLSAGSVKKFNLPSKVKGQNLGKTLTISVTDGITKAYATTDSLNGSGRNGVTFANGTATAVTPIF